MEGTKRYASLFTSGDTSLSSVAGSGAVVTRVGSGKDWSDQSCNWKQTLAVLFREKRNLSFSSCVSWGFVVRPAAASCDSWSRAVICVRWSVSP